VNVDKLANRDRPGQLSVATVLQDKTVVGETPGLHINLFSPSLKIPQRIELPLRLVLKGLPAIEPTHSVYLHALRMQSGEVFVYYGITKRGWPRTGQMANRRSPQVSARTRANTREL
jgi:hypothetical protein